MISIISIIFILKNDKTVTQGKEDHTTTSEIRKKLDSSYSHPGMH